MPTVREILLQSGLSEYEVNSLDSKATQAFSSVLAEAESQKRSVDDFWKNTYAPGISAWENEKRSLAQRLAAAESAKVAAERAAAVYSEFGQPRTPEGQFTATPGTPTLVDPNEFVGRAAAGLQQIADVDYRHRSLFNAPMPLAPSELIRQADAEGLSPLQYAEKRFGFSKKEAEIQTQRAKEAENAIRQDERQKINAQYSDGMSGLADPLRAANGGRGMAPIRRDMLEGKTKDPTRLSPEERRAQALNAIHKAVEERQQRDV